MFELKYAVIFTDYKINSKYFINLGAKCMPKLLEDGEFIV